MRIDININEILKNNESELIKKINLFSKEVKKAIDDKTPEDTKILLGNNQIGPLVRVGNKIGVRIYNDTEYASYVEYGVGKIFNYNKPKGNIFYSGVGVGMFGRTYQDYKNNFK